MGLAADVAEVAEALEREVLERVRHEAVLDVDADLDFEALSAEVLTWEIEEEDPLPAPPSGGEPRFAREAGADGFTMSILHSTKSPSLPHAFHVVDDSRAD
jgi:hypothetical protein